MEEREFAGAIGRAFFAESQPVVSFASFDVSVCANNVFDRLIDVSVTVTFVSVTDIFMSVRLPDVSVRIPDVSVISIFVSVTVVDISVRGVDVFSRHVDDVYGAHGYVHAPDGDENVADGYVHEADGDVNVRDGVVHGADGHVHEPDGYVNGTDGHVYEADGVVHDPAGHVQQATRVVGSGTEQDFAQAGGERADPILMKTKAPLCRIVNRAERSLMVKKSLAAGAASWRAMDFVSPEEFGKLLRALMAQAKVVSRRESEVEACADEWDDALRVWHKESVGVVRMARVAFAGTARAAVWRGLKARGGGRARVAKEGTALERAWESVDPAWMPMNKMLFAEFQKRRTDAESAAKAHALAVNAVAIERGILLTQADALYELCVNWYVQASATFAAQTPEGRLIRTVPTNYDLKTTAEPCAVPVPDMEPVVLPATDARTERIIEPICPLRDCLGRGNRLRVGRSYASIYHGCRGAAWLLSLVYGRVDVESRPGWREGFAAGARELSGGRGAQLPPASGPRGNHLRARRRGGPMGGSRGAALEGGGDGAHPEGHAARDV